MALKYLEFVVLLHLYTCQSTELSASAEAIKRERERERRRRRRRVRAVTNNIVYIAPEGYMAIVG